MGRLPWKVQPEGEKKCMSFTSARHSQQKSVLHSEHFMWLHVPSSSFRMRVWAVHACPGIASARDVVSRSRKGLA